MATAFPQASVELRAAEEHRIGLKLIQQKIWSQDKERPVAPAQHCYEWRDLERFVHPDSGRGVFHLATSVSVPVFEAEFAAFSATVGASRTRQIVLVLDRAGWDHIHLLFLSSYSPEFQPAERLWPLTNTALLKRRFASIEELEGAQAARCVALQARRDLVRSTTLFHW